MAKSGIIFLLGFSLIFSLIACFGIVNGIKCPQGPAKEAEVKECPEAGHDACGTMTCTDHGVSFKFCTVGTMNNQICEQVSKNMKGDCNSYKCEMQQQGGGDGNGSISSRFGCAFVAIILLCLLVGTLSTRLLMLIPDDRTPRHGP